MELNLDRYSQHCREFGLRLKKAHFNNKQPGRKTVFEYLDVNLNVYLVFTIFYYIFKFITAPFI